MASWIMAVIRQAWRNCASAPGKPCTTMRVRCYCAQTFTTGMCSVSIWLPRKHGLGMHAHSFVQVIKAQHFALKCSAMCCSALGRHVLSLQHTSASDSNHTLPQSELSCWHAGQFAAYVNVVNEAFELETVCKCRASQDYSQKGVPTTGTNTIAVSFVFWRKG